MKTKNPMNARPISANTTRKRSRPSTSRSAEPVAAVVAIRSPCSARLSVQRRRVSHQRGGERVDEFVERVDVDERACRTRTAGARFVEIHVSRASTSDIGVFRSSSRRRAALGRIFDLVHEHIGEVLAQPRNERRPRHDRVDRDVVAAVRSAASRSGTAVRRAQPCRERNLARRARRSRRSSRSGARSRRRIRRAGGAVWCRSDGQRERTTPSASSRTTVDLPLADGPMTRRTGDT